MARDGQGLEVSNAGAEAIASLDFLREEWLAFGNRLTEFVADESRFASMAGATASSRRKTSAQVRKLFKSLPADQYPVLVDLADDLSEDDPDGLFEFGIELWLRGLAQLARGAVR